MPCLAMPKVLGQTVRLPNGQLHDLDRTCCVHYQSESTSSGCPHAAAWLLCAQERY